MKKMKILATALCATVSLSAFVACGGEHEHKYTSIWHFDATHHWHECTQMGCTATQDKEEHEWDNGVIANGVKTFTCKDCKTTREEALIPEDPPKEGMPVSAVQWETAFTFSETNYTANATATHSSEGQATTSFVRDGDKMKRELSMYEQTNTMYLFKEGDTCYLYANGEKDEIEQTQYEEYMSYVNLMIQAEVFAENYDVFTFDEGERNYVAQSVSYTVMDITTTFTNVTVKFVDEKLSLLSYTDSFEEGSVRYVWYFSYGNASVTLPQMDGEQGGNGGDEGETIKYSISYKAVISGAVKEIPSVMFQADGNYPVEYVEGENGTVSDLKKEYQTFNPDGSGNEYKFKGWFLDQACTQAFMGDISLLQGEVVLYAKLSYAYWSPSV